MRTPTINIERARCTWLRCDLSRRTTLYSFASYMKNQRNAGFRFLGSAAPSANLAGADINDRTLTGLQLGILHRF